MYTFALRWEDAEKSFINLLTEDPNNTDLEASLAYARAMAGKTAEAELLYTALAAKNPNNERLLENYIRVLMANDKRKEATAQLALFGERFPESTALAALTTLTKPPEGEVQPETPGGGR
jgi:predicted Zn-dependent protease